MAAVNDITGDPIISKKNSKEFANRYNWAFCKDFNHKPKDEELFRDHSHICGSCGMISVVKYGKIVEVKYCFGPL